MPKKLTKHQKYNRKRRKDGSRDFRKVAKDGKPNGVRVTRKQISFYISNEAAERLQQKASNAEIHKWEMASRMILKSLPGILSAGYAELRSPEAIDRYKWNVLYVEPIIKRIQYRSGKAEKRLTMDITSTAWNKIHCHSTATERSMSQIFQSLCLNYKPLTPEQREQKKLAREEYLRNEELPLEQRTSRYYKPYEQPSKFLDVGYEFIHAKGIPIEYWDEAETEEFCALMEQKMTKLKDREEERQKRYDELFGKPKCSDQNSAS